MGQKQSKECADKKGTYNLSAQDAVREINIFLKLIENADPTALSDYINDSLNGWKKEQIKFAITGLAGTGKSTFINTIRHLIPGDADFAETGSGDTTMKPTFYMHPKNDKITFCDLPGYSTTACKKEDYIRAMKLCDYDLFFIFFINVLSQEDIWLVHELLKLGKPFALVRSKIDVDIDNAKYDNKKKEMIIPEIKRKIQKALDANPEVKATKGIFLISSRKPHLGEMSELMTYVEENIGEIKAEAFLFSLHCITKELFEKKQKMLMKRLIGATALAACVSVIPVPGLDIKVNTTLLQNEVLHYKSVFGIGKDMVDSLKFDHSLLKCASLLTPNFDVVYFVVSKIGSFGTVVLAKSVSELIFPLIGSSIYSITTAGMTYAFLSNVLQDIKDDAVLIYAHIMNV